MKCICQICTCGRHHCPVDHHVPVSMDSLSQNPNIKSGKRYFPSKGSVACLLHSDGPTELIKTHYDSQFPKYKSVIPRTGIQPRNSKHLLCYLSGPPKYDTSYGQHFPAIDLAKARRALILQRQSQGLLTGGNSDLGLLATILDTQSFSVHKGWSGQEVKEARRQPLRRSDYPGITSMGVHTNYSTSQKESFKPVDLSQSGWGVVRFQDTALNPMVGEGKFSDATVYKQSYTSLGAQQRTLSCRPPAIYKPPIKPLENGTTYTREYKVPDKLPHIGPCPVIDLVDSSVSTEGNRNYQFNQQGVDGHAYFQRKWSVPAA